MSITLKPYASYGESDVPWLSHVPSHWKSIRVDRLFRLRSEEPLEGDGRVTGYLDGRVTLRSNVAGQKIKGVVKEAGWQRIHVGDFAISGMNAHLGGMGVSDSEGKCSPIYLVLEPKAGTNARFVSLAVRHAAHLGAIKALVQTIRFNSADMKRDDLKSIYVQVPSCEEQDTIVGFIRHLDHRVNRFVKAKRRLVELLNEQKQAIINQALGSGSDSSTNGDKWQIGHLARVGNGSTPNRGTPDYWSRSDVGFPWLNSGSVNRGRICDSDQFISDIALRECHLPKVPCGSILVAITGEGKTRGTAAILEFEATINQHLAYITPVNKRVSPEYLHLVLTASYQDLRDCSESSGSTKAALTCADIRKFKIKVPIRKMQDEIVDQVQGESRKIDIAISKARREIDLIREYRTRLVVDVVTGQIDVREVAAQLSEDAVEEETDAEEAVEDDLDAEIEEGEV